MARRTPAEHLHLALFGDPNSLRTELDVAVAFQSVPQHRVAVLKHHLAFPVVGLKGVGGVPDELQVWSLTQFYSVDFSKSRISVKKCVFNKRTIKVCVSCC